MNDEFLKIKKHLYFSNELNHFKEVLHSMGIARGKDKSLENAIFRFLIKVKEPIYREVDSEYLRQDVMDKIKEWYGIKGLRLAKAIPSWVIESIIDKWQDQLGDSDTYWDANWSILNNVLSEESWLMCFKNYTRKQMSLYTCYLKDLYSKHQSNENPVPIRQFFNRNMQDDKLKNYYLSLVERYTKRKR